ncbi:MAG: type II toxin-antitoxin system Y4mF family antitoxin [Planctomycetota bacterium]
MHDHAFPQSLGERLRQRRAELGLKQVDLAELAGCSTRFVHAAEAGKPTLRLDKLLQLLDVLGLRLVVEPAHGGDPR